MIIDRNLLFAVLALEGDFLTRQQFLEVCRTWAPRKHTSLGELLVQSGWLTPADKAAIDRLLERKLGKHQGDIRAALLSHTDDWMRHSLLSLGDAGITHVLSAQTIASKLAPPANPQPQFGRRERYTLSRLHASGGLGHIWIAHDPDLDRDVALKEIRPDHGDQYDVRLRFLSEARITGRLEHPGVVPVYELSQDSSGRPFYAMRFIQGRTLSEAVEEYHLRRAAQGVVKPTQETKAPPLPFVFRDLLSRFISVCQTVGYAHSKGIIHRDLKTDNVMLGDFGETLIVDWGLAKPFGSGEVVKWREKETSTASPPQHSTSSATASPALTQAGSIIGTPMYMAPEQTIGNPQLLGPWTDIHALGLMLYVLLTGKSPYEGDPVEVMLKIRNRPPIPPSHVARHVPRALEAICLKAMAKQPEDRYASAAELAEEVQRWLADEPVQVCREPVVVRLRRWVKRHRTLVTGAAAALLVGVVALAFATVFLSAANRQTMAERDRADKNLELARKAVDDTLARVSKHPRLRHPDLLDLRKELLASVVPLYEQLAKQQGDDPRAESERGLALGQLALVHNSLGQSDLALKEFREKEAIFRALTKAHPDIPTYHQELASALHGLSILYRTSGRRDESFAALMDAIKLLRSLPNQAPELMAGCLVTHGNLLQEGNEPTAALEVYREARQLFERLCETAPGDLNHRHGLAVCENNLGGILASLDQLEEAERMLRHAVDLREQLAKEDELPSRMLDVARSCGGLGMVLARQEAKRQEAEELFRKAVALLEPMVGRSPVLPEYRRELSLILRYHIKLLDDLGRAAEAEPSARLAVEQLTVLHQDSRGTAYRIELGVAYSQLGTVLQAKEQYEAALPPYAEAIARMRARAGLELPPQVQQILRDTHAQRAEALTFLGRHAEALKDWETAIALSSSDTDLFRVYHAITMARMGQVSAALTKTEPWAASPSGPVLLALARLYAVAATAHPESAQRETCATSALALLGQARDANAFKERKNQAMLGKCKDFDALRNKPAFQKLLKEVTGG